MGMFGQLSPETQAMLRGQQIAVAPQAVPDFGAPTISAKPGFFGQGGPGRAIAGSIGDALLQLGHMQPVYAPAMKERLAIAERQRARAQEIEDQRSTWLMEQQYKAAHPDPNSAPDVVQLARIANDPTQPDYVRKAASDRIAAQNDPIITANLPGGSFYNGPRSGLVSVMQGGGGPASGGAGGGAPRDIPLVSSPDEARRLPPGSEFRTPDGRVLRVPGGPTHPASGSFR